METRSSSAGCARQGARAPAPRPFHSMWVPAPGKRSVLLHIDQSQYYFSRRVRFGWLVKFLWSLGQFSLKRVSLAPTRQISIVYGRHLTRLGMDDAGSGRRVRARLPNHDSAIYKELRSRSPRPQIEPRSRREMDLDDCNMQDAEPRWIVRCRCGCHHDNTTDLDCERCKSPMIACDKCDVWLHLECLGFASDGSKVKISSLGDSRLSAWVARR